MRRTRLLRPIRETVEDYEQIERAIRAVFRREIYLPLLRILGKPDHALQNSRSQDPTDVVREALHSSRITFDRGVFSGSFSAPISKALKALGARWHRPSGTWRITAAKLPYAVRAAIGSSEARFTSTVDEIDRRLAEISPEELAGRVNVSAMLDRAIYKVERDFQSSVKGILVSPTVSETARKKIAAEWANNLQLYIREFTEKETKELRDKVSLSAYSGDRYQSLIDDIQRSYGVSARKAKFLARQETGLLMAKFKEARYKDSGIDEYHWYHVEGTPDHPVRPIHRKLGDAKEPDGKKKVYRFSDPPIVDDQGNRKNPQQDYNCRCYARPLVRF